jgi:hypothetical protein
MAFPLTVASSSPLAGAALQREGGSSMAYVVSSTETTPEGAYVVSSTETTPEGKVLGWFSSDGTRELLEIIGPSGQIDDINQRVATLTGGANVQNSIDVYPSEHLWTTLVYRDQCSPLCADSSTPVFWKYQYLPIPQFFQGAASKFLHVIEGPKSFDGQRAVELGAAGGGARFWISTATEQVIEKITPIQAGGQTVTSYRWLPATVANLALLHAAIPAGYRHQVVS